MTPEEMQALIDAQNAKIEQLSAVADKVSELEARVNPPAPDPDEKYKPSTWKELDDKINRTAEEKALKIIEEAENKKKELAKEEQENRKKQDEMIDAALKKLEEEKIIEPTANKDDLGGKQRTQILGMTLRFGGTDVEAAARTLKTAWDNGLEYDYETNAFKKAGGYQTPYQPAYVPPVGSSSSRVPAPNPTGPIVTAGINGDLDEAQRRWEETHR